MDQLLVFAQQWWWAGLIPSLIAVILYFWYRHYRKTHVESQCVVTLGCSMATIMLIYYIVCIVAGLFSILGVILKLFK